jgi:hypothetical protein
VNPGYGIYSRVESFARQLLYNFIGEVVSIFFNIKRDGQDPDDVQAWGGSLNRISIQCNVENTEGVQSWGGQLEQNQHLFETPEIHPQDLGAFGRPDRITAS